MVFSSLLFLFGFLPLVLLAYALVPRAQRNLLLLAASIGFYAWGEGWYVAVMLASIAFNYVAGLAIAAAPVGRPRQAVLAGGIAVNLGALVYFKYTGFLVGNLGTVCATLGGPALQADPVHLPIGISFFTFQALSYLIDVGRGEVAATRDPVGYGMYISFFPQLIAGPIVRYRDVAHEVGANRAHDPDLFLDGARRFVVGLAKKVLIANTLSVPADAAFRLGAGELTTPIAWFGLLCYAGQIYYDFSGYSDMAIGLGRMFGFHFRENFLHPYSGQTVQDFWRRWHISLSSWFRDYVYIPLGGSRRGPWRTAANLVLVFALCGFWHGAAWVFVFWGLWHGVFLAAEHFGGRDLVMRLPRPLRHGYTLLVVLIGWVLFRAVDTDHALRYLAALTGTGGLAWEAFASGEEWAILAIAVFGAVPWWASWWPRVEARRSGRILAGLGATVLFALALGMLLLQSANPFIYFRF